MNPNANTIKCTATKNTNVSLLDPSFTIHRSNFSIIVKPLGSSPLTSPDSNILDKGVDLERSDMEEEVDEVGDRPNGFS